MIHLSTYRRQNKVSDSSSIFVIQLYNKLMTTNLRVWRHARNWQIVSFMKKLFLEDFIGMYAYLLSLANNNGGCGFHFAMTLKSFGPTCKIMVDIWNYISVELF